MTGTRSETRHGPRSADDDDGDGDDEGQCRDRLQTNWERTKSAQSARGQTQIITLLLFTLALEPALIRSDLEMMKFLSSDDFALFFLSDDKLKMNLSVFYSFTHQTKKKPRDWSHVIGSQLRDPEGQTATDSNISLQLL